jgi:putative ABC transport system permease protein
MNFVALKMLVGDTAKYLGMIFGVTFASFLMVQQGSIFWGLMSRTAGFVADQRQHDIWVTDPDVRFVDDAKPLQDTALTRVRGVNGVDWAVPMFRGNLSARLQGERFEQIQVIGIDDATLIGGPMNMVEGSLEDLRQSDAVIVDEFGANNRLASRGPNGEVIPLKVGDTLELNDRRAVVVGICKLKRTFQSQPALVTTYTRATQFAPAQRRLLSFVLVKADASISPEALAQRIRDQTGLGAHTGEQFWWKTFWFFVAFTGIPINFGISVTLGFLVGTAIVGQTFYQFTADNIRHFGALKAMGTSNWRIAGMIVLQAMVVGIIGYGIGAGLAAIMVARVGTEGNLAIIMTRWHLILAAVAVLVIISLSALLSMVKIIRVEPAIVFRG